MEGMLKSCLTSVNYRGVPLFSLTTVPEDINDRPNLDDDAIISDDEVFQLLDEDAKHDSEQEQSLQLLNVQHNFCYTEALDLAP
ncbi:hypothetical protein AVEN_117501-1 [Araneus ventricosus]|uniref:Uncharacterized protein n=1 Tax=Araneus ventricosus TaxID=182803 RepID=A0A4Y2SM59_ARAVE|nr:hypothetical protein AVEN_237399-1 [Araneus ventricosus]GBN88206.1 hypothetical protein AVEN_117501-1 [Araneus ventricosus]